MAHQLYDNFVLENKIEDLLITKIDLNNYITVDYSLTQEPGMKKIINVYSSTGSVEDLAMGEGNKAGFEVTMTEVEYEVDVTQGYFPYFDEQTMRDPLVVEVGVKGMSEDMTNDLTRKAIAEYEKATLAINGFTWDFDGVVDAIALLNVEDEAGLFMLVSPADKATIRKALKDDLVQSEGYVRTGYIGSVAGVPVITTKAVPAGKAYLATKEAVTCFVKKGVEVEQERDANTRKNEIFARKVMLVALTNANKVVKLVTAPAAGE